ncbi:unnamed protein product [Calicophoron daubneyi]|uniref:Translation initiation factor eIF2B subunit delta n=1 Tax=Calicophoron daubneyi TaxID=300641 RepID=A0AAV2THE0_CALDB
MEGTKSKAQLRAERRALQEAQRAAKLSAREGHKPVPQTVICPQDGTGTASNTGVAIDGISEVERNAKKSGTAAHSEKKPPKAQAKKGAANAQKSSEKIKPEIVDKVPTAAQKEINGRMQIGGSFLIPSRKKEVHRVHLFKHLVEPDKRQSVIDGVGLGSHSAVHPTFLALGINYDEGRIWGSNERCLHFLSACESLIRSYQPDSWARGTEAHAALDSSLFARSFGPVLQRHMDFLNRCRPLAVTMRNAYQHLKQKLSSLDSVDDWEECRNGLLTAIDVFRQTAIYLAGSEIAERASSYIRPGECVCTFGYSSLVARVLERAWFGPSKATGSTHSGLDEVNSPGSGEPAQSPILSDLESSCPTNTVPLRFSVLVVDARPRFEGRRMLARLTKAGVPCEYTHIAALPIFARKVSLAIVGAHALLNNGFVVARMGTAQVANVVSAIAHVPTLVCAETYKFSERAHSDAFESNELGDPDDIWRGPRGTSMDPKQGIPGRGPTGLPNEATIGVDLSDWRSNPKLHLLHLQYDVLPPELVTAVVTEKGTLPTTSVPVVLRVKQEASFPL